MKGQVNGSPKPDASRVPLVFGVKHSLILFHGCIAGAAGVCNALVRFTIVEPDGTRSPAGEGPLWTAQPAAKGQILLSSTSMTVGFGRGDKLGKYKVLATAIDMEANKQVDASASFALQ